MIPELDINAAKERLDAGTADFVDVRDPGSYSSGHIAGARHITDQSLPEFLEEADKSRPLVVYCYSGQSSMGATDFFIRQGFAEVYSMSGGFEAWRMTHTVSTD